MALSAYRSMRTSLFLTSSLHLVGEHVPGDVQVALLHLQAPAAGLGDVLVDHPLHLGRVAEVARVGVQDDPLALLPLAQDERPGAGRVPRQPGHPVIPVRELVRLGDVLLHDLGVHHAADDGGHAGQEQAARVLLGERDLHGVGVQRLDRLRREAELGEDEGRLVLQEDGALEGVDHVLGRHRIAGVKLHPFAQVEGPHQAVRGDLPGLGQRGFRLVELAGGEVQQPVVHLGHDPGADHLEALGRVEGGDHAHLLPDHQDLGPALRQRRRPAGNQQHGNHRKEDQRALHDHPPFACGPADRKLAPTCGPFWGLGRSTGSGAPGPRTSPLAWKTVCLAVRSVTSGKAAPHGTSVRPRAHRCGGSIAHASCACQPESLKKGFGSDGCNGGMATE